MKQYASQGRRSLLLCFYAGHGYGNGSALLNSNRRGHDERGNNYILDDFISNCAHINGTYSIGLFACGRLPRPEEEKRGGTELIVPTQIQDPGQSITIYAV